MRSSQSQMGTTELTTKELSDISECLNQKQSRDFFSREGYSFTIQENYAYLRLFRQYQNICANKGIFRITKDSKDNLDNYKLEGQLFIHKTWTSLIDIPLPELHAILAYLYPSTPSGSPPDEKVVTELFTPLPSPTTLPILSKENSRSSENLITRPSSDSSSHKTLKTLKSKFRIQNPGFDELKPFSDEFNISSSPDEETSTSFSPEQLELVCEYIKDHCATKPPSEATHFLKKIPALEKSLTALKEYAKKLNVTPLCTTAKIFNLKGYSFRISRDKNSNQYFFLLAVPARGINSVSVEVTPDEIQSILDHRRKTKGVKSQVETSPIEKTPFRYSSRALSRAERNEILNTLKARKETISDEKKDESPLASLPSVEREQEASAEKENISPQNSPYDGSENETITNDVAEESSLPRKEATPEPTTAPSTVPSIHSSQEILPPAEIVDTDPPIRPRALALADTLFFSLPSYSRCLSVESYFSKGNPQNQTNSLWFQPTRARRDAIIGPETTQIKKRAGSR